MDRDAWRAAIYGVAKSRTQVSDWNELNWQYWSVSSARPAGPGRPAPHSPRAETTRKPRSEVPPQLSRALCGSGFSPPPTLWRRPRLQPFVYLLRVRAPWLTWKPRAASGSPSLAWVSVFGVGPASRSLLFFVPRVWGSLLTLNPRSRPTTPSKFRRLRKRWRGACLLL